jgi:hypothetical protein
MQGRPGRLPIHLEHSMATVETLQSRIENLVAMARLLERVDANPALIGARQYQSLARKVQSLLDDPELPEAALQAVLGASAACATLYENLHYDRSGLSQSPLDAAVSSEVSATELIARVGAPAHPGT